MLTILNGSSHFWQWDTNQYLIVDNPDVNQIHFASPITTSSYVCEVFASGSDRVACVPNAILQQGIKFFAYSVIANNNGITAVAQQTFLVYPRVKPEDYVYTETEVFKYETVLATAQRAAEDAADAKADSATAIADASSAVQVAQGVRDDADAGVFKGDTGEAGYTPVRGTDYWTAADITTMESYLNNYVNTVILGGAS